MGRPSGTTGRGRLGEIAAALVLAGLGVALFRLLGLPLPWLLGPMFAGLAAGLGGARLAAPPGIAAAMRTVLGVAVGAAITPELLGRLPGMVVSVALIPAFVLAVGLVGVPYFRRVCGFDAPTAYFSAMPGGFQDMVVLGAAAGGDTRVLSLVHATRVLAIVAVMPALMTGLWGRDLDVAAGQPAAAVPPGDIAVMLVCAGAGWWLAVRARLFGAAILGPMLLAMAASLTGLLHARPPVEAILAAQFFIGLAVGTTYRGITLGEVRSVILAALGFCAILTALSALFAEVVVQLDLAGPVEAFLAFAPGGQAEMVVLAIAAGADMAFVVTHHLVRVTVVLLGAPLAARRAQGQ